MTETLPPPADGAAPADPGPVASDPAVIDAAAEVAAARAALEGEIVALRASARAAVDVKGKVRRNPGKTAAVAGGAAFLAVGGPKRLFRAVKRRIVGEPEPLPPSLLPEQVEKAVRALGDDGAKVRGALERGFAGFLESTSKDRKAEARQRSLVGMAMKVGMPVAQRLAREGVDRMLREARATSAEMARRPGPEPEARAAQPGGPDGSTAPGGGVAQPAGGDAAGGSRPSR